MEKIEKKKKPFWRKLLKFLLVTASVFLVIGLLTASILYGISYMKTAKKAKYFAENVLVDDLQAKETLYEMMRESEDMLYGHSIADLEAMGIDILEEDTSGNGLTDEEELEYGLDPSLYSSAGDGISDLVKILEGIDPHEKIADRPEFTIDFAVEGVTLRTNDLNDKYFSDVRLYRMSSVTDIYDSVVEPFQVLDYEGQVELTVPESKVDKKTLAYQFNFETLKMEKIKKQKYTDGIYELQIDNKYPVFILNKQDVKELAMETGEFLYFRFSLPYIENLVGFNHKVFIFKKSTFTSLSFEQEESVHEAYGIIDYSYQKIGFIGWKLVGGLFKMLDDIFVREELEDTLMQKEGFIDYGSVVGTLEFAKETAMPWLLEEKDVAKETDEKKPDKNLEKDEEADDLAQEIDEDLQAGVIADSGFRMNEHAFRFSNTTTTLTPGGACAGFALLTEKVYNGSKIPLQDEIKLKSKVKNHIKKNSDLDVKSLSYDIENNQDHYTFLNTKQQYSYKMTDPLLEMMTDGDVYTKPERPIDITKVKDPDKSLFDLIVYNYIEQNNDLTFKWTNPTSYDVIEKVTAEVAAGNVVTASMSGFAGHAVTVYRVEQDEYDPDKVYFYIYDNNFPVEEILYYNNGKNTELKMEIVKNQKRGLLFNKKYEYDFHFSPFEAYDKLDYYYWSSMGENKDKVIFRIKGDIIK